MNKYSFSVTPTPKERPSNMNMSKPPVPTNRTMKRDSPRIDTPTAFSKVLLDNGFRASDCPTAVAEALSQNPNAEHWKANVLPIHNLLCGTFGGQG
jgi:hypothetical protein